MPNADFGVYSYGLTAGTEVSSTYEGRHVTLVASEIVSPTGTVVKGNPVVFGTVGLKAVGVAFTSEVAATDLIAIDTEGIWNLAVLGTDDAGGAGGVVVGGDLLYINVGTCIISKIRNIATQIPFGYALGGVAQDTSTVIAVKVHFDPHYENDGQIFKTMDVASPGAYAAAMKLIVDSDIAQTGTRLCALSVNLEPGAALAAQDILGAEVCTYLAADIPVAGSLNGLFVETQGGLSYGGDARSLYVYLAVNAAPTGSSQVARFEHNSGTYSFVDEFIALVGDAPAAFAFGPLDENNAWSIATAPNGAATGHIHVIVGSSVREVPLYTPA